MLTDTFTPQEKGRAEWMAFNAVRGDHVDMFPVAALRRFVLPRLRLRKDRFLIAYRLKGAN